MPEREPLSLTTARRLAVSCQHLAGPRGSADLAGIQEVLRALRCLQLDPIKVVAQSHLLVLWSRLGSFDPALVDTLLWEDRWLFEYWAHAASIVLTEDYPIHAATMRRYPGGVSRYGQRVAAWLGSNELLRTHVLERLQESGSLTMDGFKDVAEVPWTSSGWTSGRNVERMLDLLWLQGQVTVSGRVGRSRQWDLTGRALPGVADLPTLPDEQVVRQAAEYALKALGVARPADIVQHFTRDRYPGLESALKELESSGRVLRVAVEGAVDRTEEWYLHADNLPLLERIEAGEWEPRTTLLSPFDNLICNRERTERLWGFAFRNEMYLPKQRRQYGYYVLAVLHGDRLIGRIAPRLDRRRRVLQIEGVYAEPDAPNDEGTARAVAASLAELADFVGAEETVHTGPTPEAWRSAFPAVAPG